MESPKAFLPFGPELMLPRVVRLLQQAVESVVVAAGPDQAVPPLPPQVHLVRDRRRGCGPLAGIEAGLRAIQRRAQAAFVTGCDLPLLEPAFVRRVVELAAGYGIAVPYIDGLYQPLAAVYHTDVLPHVESLLAAGQLRPSLLFDLVRTRKIEARELVDCDPHLRSLSNVNSPADYRKALQEAGFPPQGPQKQ